MLGYLDIVSSMSHLILKGVNTSVVLLFDFNSFLKHYHYHCYNNRNIMISINHSIIMRTMKMRIYIYKYRFISI